MKISRHVQILSVLLALSFLVVTAVPADAHKRHWWHKHHKTYVKKFRHANHRFKPLRQFDRMAVLDRETGLVWERAPETRTYSNRGYHQARRACGGKNIADRGGWRLPTVNEASGVMPLPTNDTFEGVGGYVWTSAVDFTMLNPSGGFLPSPVAVNVDDGSVQDDGGAIAMAWCVRGAIQGSNQY